MDWATVWLVLGLLAVIVYAAVAWCAVPDLPTPRHPFADPDGGPWRSYARARRRDADADWWVD